jgi:hypothetical protein
MSGTAQIYGDAEVHGVTVNRGVFTGFIDQNITTNIQHGSNLTALPREVTAERSMRWYGEATVQTRHAAPVTARSFNMNNRGIFAYNFGNDNVGAAQLKIFDIRGKLINTVPLTGTHGTVNTRVNAAQTVFWRVESSNGKVIETMGRNTLVR